MDDDDDDDVDNNPGDFDKFCSDYYLEDEGVFDNNKFGEGKGFCCMTVTDSWDPHVKDYKDDNTLLQHSAFDTGGDPSIYPNFFHGTLITPLVNHTPTMVQFPKQMYYTTPCSNPR